MYNRMPTLDSFLLPGLVTEAETHLKSAGYVPGNSRPLWMSNVHTLGERCSHAQSYRSAAAAGRPLPDLRALGRVSERCFVIL